MPKKIFQVEPREQIGAVTGQLYDFQYLQAARASLKVLESGGVTCVLCEWHDDFVLESAGSSSALYAFHQVKSRAATKGPWTVRTVFGLGKASKKKPPKPAESDCIAARMLEHDANFDHACAEVVLVTNSAGNPEFCGFLEDVRAAPNPANLSGDSSALFSEMAAAYASAFGTTQDRLFGFLKRFRILSECGSPADFDVDMLRIAKRIRELSEIDLKFSQAEQIGRDLVDLVRKKSHAKVQLPVDEAELKSLKAINASEILALLSLSSAGFEELRASGDQKALASLSRLHKICVSSGIDPGLIADICRFKAQWDAWLHLNRPDIEQLQLTLLRSRCLDVLNAHAGGGFNFEDLAAKASDLAQEYSRRLNANVELNADLVVGFIFSLAAVSKLSE